jgi:phosphoribosylaminoimidazole-succinocarboxamide synthase
MIPSPIITPATKAKWAITMKIFLREDIIKKGIVTEEDYLVLEDYTRKLFKRGSEIAVAV